MVIATITISGHAGMRDIAVEVLGKGPYHGTAWVQTLNGLQPFIRTTHGGPCQEDYAAVAIRRLRDVRVVSAVRQSEAVEGSVRPLETVQLALPAGCFPEQEDALAYRRPGGRPV